MSDARDRDGDGRARSSRPRDAAGRPLPRGERGVRPVPDDPGRTPDASVDLAQELLDDGRPFAAHEVLEAAWKAAPPDRRDLWQGLAQVAVGLTHLQRGNPRGARTLLTRGADHLTGDAPVTAGIDAAGVAAYARSLAAAVDTPGGQLPPPPRLRG